MTGRIGSPLPTIAFAPGVLVEVTNVMSNIGSSKSEHYYSAIAGIR